MKIGKIIKRIISFVIIVTFIVGFIPTRVNATEDEGEDWIEIRTATDLYNIRNNLSGNYKLMNDIDLSEVTAEGGMFDFQGNGWKSIGSDTEFFYGIFDGQGFSINGLNMKENGNYTGLFAGNKGTIKNITLSNFTITNSALNQGHIGSIVGCNKGVLDGIIVTEGSFVINKYYTSHIGGIAGINDNLIKNCFSDADFIEGTLSNTEAKIHVGVIAGGSSSNSVSSRVECCVSKITEHISKEKEVRFAEISKDGEILDSYCVTDGLTHSFAVPGGNSSAKRCYWFYKDYVSYFNSEGKSTRLNLNQMCSQMFYEDFDFDNTWFIDENYTYKLPMLRNTYNGDIKSEITPELSIENWTYGDIPNEPELIGNTGEGSVTYEYKLCEADDDTYSETVPTEAGEYFLRASIEETTYYKSAEVTCDFTIEQKPLTISGITANNKQYDGNSTANLDCSSAWISGLVGSEEISVSATGSFDNKNADNNKVVSIASIKFSGDKAGNYKVNTELSQKETTANIIKKRIYVNADNMSKSYGEDDPVFTYTAEGFVNGETADSLVTGALGRDNGENVGTYAINQGTLAFGNNYIVSFTGAQLRINKAKGDHTKPNPPVFLSRTETSITVQAESGYEYSIDGGLFWNVTGVFENLNDNTSYSIVTRKAATQNVEAGVISDALGVRTAAYHVHDYSSNVETEPTCTEKGVKRFTCECGESYTEDIPALGHDYGELIAEVSATCTTAGKKAHYKCSRCNKLFVKEGTEYVEKTELELKILSTGHTFDQEVVDDEYLKSAADCTHAAVYYKSCHCGEKGNNTFTSGQALGHDWNEGVVTKEAKCTEAGVKTFTCTRTGCNESRTEVIPATGHDYGDLIEETSATCTLDGMKAHYECSSCKKLFVKVDTAYVEKTVSELNIPATGHTFDQEVVDDKYLKQAETCTSAAVYYKSCLCGEKGTETFVTNLAFDHVWDEGVVTKEATCTEAGVKTFTCTRTGCNESRTEEILAIGHDYGDLIEETPATCTLDGMKAHYKCSNCNKLFVKEGAEYIEKNENDLKISATGHTFDKKVAKNKYIKQKADCTHPLTYYKSCVCGEKGTETFTVGKALGHDWDEGVIIQSETCTEDGEIKYTCKRTGCNESYTDTIPAKGHDYGNIIPELSATCIVDGIKAHYKCSSCDKLFEKDGAEYVERTEAELKIAASGHNYESVITKEATCKEKGIKTFTCSECNDEYTEDIPKCNHTPEDIPAIDATCTEDGMTAGSKCSVCGEYIVKPTVDTPAYGHTWRGIITKEATCIEKGVKTFTCECGETKTEEIMLKPHMLSYISAKEATTTEEGSKEYYTCLVCGKWFEDSTGTKEIIDHYQVVIPKKIDDKNSSGGTSEGNPSSSTGSGNSYTDTIKNKFVNGDKGRQYYKDDGTVAQNEWLTINNIKYYFNADGYAASNEWRNGKWISEDGSCTYAGELIWKNNSTGWWVEDSKGWYPVSSWQKIDGVWYYFNDSGYMASNEYYNGYWFNADGSWDDTYYLTWKSNSSGWWVEDKSGWYPSSKWLKIDGSWYYFNSSGYMVTSQYVDGYWIGADGVCQ